MTWGINVLFNAPEDLVTIIDELESLWLVSFKRKFFAGRELYRFEGLNLIIDLFDQHGLEDDKNIRFQTYRYELDIHLTVKLDGHQDLCRSFAIFVATQMHQKFGYECVVVEDLQEKLLELS